ncbi:hypothetical protein E7T06_14455 [Deinococcus sp. Arct2-2]|uniref:hypothetical protein n=1 Tax=Deinococcus sp. Arct2-2 TaxID=2568653 RepID=UPI0010A4DBA6|nr:hypothetical protein [Deinococcus sp. Arct2-2]THF68866.1 hypothetical protein E7T06_14455 [Deinococcus sp. Arct2-2]
MILGNGGGRVAGQLQGVNLSRSNSTNPSVQTPYAGAVIPAPVALEARVFYHLLIADVVQTVDVVRWADGWIVQLQTPPEALLEVSLNGKRLNDLIHSLRELADPKFSSDSVEMLCRMLHQHLVQQPDELQRVVRLLYGANVEGVLPDQFAHEVSMLDDLLDLAFQGSYGTVDDIHSETVDILERYGAVLPEHTELI